MEVTAYRGGEKPGLKGDLGEVGVAWIFIVMNLIPAFLGFFMVFPAQFIEMAAGVEILDNIYFLLGFNRLGSILVILYFVMALRGKGIDIRAIMGEKKIPVKKIVFYGVFFVVVETAVFVLIDYYRQAPAADYYDLNDKPTEYLLLFAAFTVLLTPVYEEFIMRGLLFNKLTEKTGVRSSLIIIGVLFAFLHGFTKGMVFIISGYAFYHAYLYHKTKSLYASMLFHITGNLAACIGGLLSEVWLPDTDLSSPARGSMLAAAFVLLICSPVMIKFFTAVLRESGDKKESVYMYNVGKTVEEGEVSV